MKDVPRLNYSNWISIELYFRVRLKRCLYSWHVYLWEIFNTCVINLETDRNFPNELLTFEINHFDRNLYWQCYGNRIAIEIRVRMSRFNEYTSHMCPNSHCRREYIHLLHCAWKYSEGKSFRIDKPLLIWEGIISWSVCKQISSAFQKNVNRVWNVNRLIFELNMHEICWHSFMSTNLKIEQNWISINQWTLITIRNAHVRKIFRGKFGACSESTAFPLFHRLPLHAHIKIKTHEFKTTFQATPSIYTIHDCIGPVLGICILSMLNIECWTWIKEIEGIHEHTRNHTGTQ